MSTFKFDETEDFDANVQALLDYLAGEDPEMKAILSAHITKLKGATDDTRRGEARSAFNDAVISDLDDLLTLEKQGGNR